MVTEKRFGIIGLFLTLLVGASAGSGGTLLLNDGELADAYVCSTSGEVGIFHGGISGTGLTAYPFAENRTQAKQCVIAGVKGVWQSCNDYAAARGATCSEIFGEKANVDLAPVVRREELVYADGTRLFLKCVEE